MKKYLSFVELLKLRDDLFAYIKTKSPIRLKVIGKWNSVGILLITVTPADTNISIKPYVSVIKQISLEYLKTLNNTFYDFYFPEEFIQEQNIVRYRANLHSMSYYCLDDTTLLSLCSLLYKYIRDTVYCSDPSFPDYLTLKGHENYCEVQWLFAFDYNTHVVSSNNKLLLTRGDLNLIGNYCTRILKRLSAYPYSLSQIDLKPRNHNSSNFLLNIGTNGKEEYILLSDVPEDVLKMF